MEFLHWVMLYNDIFQEMFGEDKEEALNVIDNDEAFDAWLKRYSLKMKNLHKNTHTKGKKVDKDTYFSRTKGTLPQPKLRNKNPDASRD